MSDEYIGFDEISVEYPERFDEAWNWIKKDLRRMTAGMTKKEALECLYSEGFSIHLEAIHECLPDGIDYDNDEDVYACEQYYIDDVCDYLEESFNKKFGDGWKYSTPELERYYEKLIDRIDY